MNLPCHSRWVLFVLAAGLSVPALAEEVLPSETDFLDELPTVLTVTRLAQPLSETPGAVTIITRDTIRRSGARELTDVLRLVPGYAVGGWNGANPNAVYHAPFDDERGQRNLVLIDGRRVYSAFALGDTFHGMMSVLIDDIERIEVLRGSNSAAYGANAMFGVINIITRHSADTTGVALSMTGGESGISDHYASWGWHDGHNGFRLSTGERSDTGWRNIYDDKKIRQAHLRADLEPAPDQQLMLTANVVDHFAGEGFATDPFNALRTMEWHNWSISGDWHWQYAPERELRVLASYDADLIRDSAPVTGMPVVLDQGGKGERWNLEVTQSAVWNEGLQGVWGFGYLYETAESKPVYAERSPVKYTEWRAFGNLGWSPWVDRLTINLGGFAGWHSDTGTYFTPRLMANLQLMQGQTLRAGITEAVRTPSIFEIAGNMHYYLNAPFAGFPAGTLVGVPVSTRGVVQPERLKSREVGYLGVFHDWNLTVDVRGFYEEMNDRIGTTSYPLPLPIDPGARTEEAINVGPDIHWRGYESQTRWKPLAGTEIWLNQTRVHTVRDDGGTKNSAPERWATLALFQQLPADMDLTLMYHQMGAMNWRSANKRLPAFDRVDVRLAKHLSMLGTQGELALTVQAVNGDYKEFLGSENYLFERRAFATLRLQF